MLRKRLASTLPRLSALVAEVALVAAVVVACVSQAAPTRTPSREGEGKLGTARSEAGASSVVARVQARYDSTQSLSASFEQELRLASAEQVIRQSGKVYFSKPGRMRWEYTSSESDQQTIVADGKYIWFDQPRDNQVLKAPFKEGFQSGTPVSFLLGVGRLEEDFKPSLKSPSEDGTLRLRLDPKGEDGGVGSLTFDLDPVTFDIRAATIVDPLGNTTRLTLREVRRNQKPDESLFRFTPRPGVDVIEAPSR